MQELLRYLFTQFVSDEGSPLVPLLLKLQPVRLTSHMKLSQPDLQLVQYLLSKNFITYSPAHLQLTLNPHNILFYQRVYKLKHFAAQHTLPAFQQLLQAFINNELLPVPTSVHKLHELQHKQTDHTIKNKQEPKTKIKKKEVTEQLVHTKSSDSTEQLDYTRLVYQYSQKAGNKDEQVECMVNINELLELLRFYKIQQTLGIRREEYLKGINYKEGEQPLHSLSFLEMYRIVRENRPQSEFIKQIIQRVRQEKIEEYILQLYRRHDEQKTEENHPPRHNARNLLLVFNLIRKWPLISEKELLGKSLLAVLELRKCLNLLVTDGFINYYPENFRSVLYRITNYEEIEKRFVNHIATALLNLHLRGKDLLSKDQLLRIECMIADLDDLLLLFNF